MEVALTLTPTLQKRGTTLHLFKMPSTFLSQDVILQNTLKELIALIFILKYVYYKLFNSFITACDKNPSFTFSEGIRKKKKPTKLNIPKS